MPLPRLLAQIAVLAIALAIPAAGQNRTQDRDLYAPAVVVNDQLITEFDIQQRIRLMQILGGVTGDLRQAAIETLIDDRLREQAARQAGIKLSDEQIQAALKEFAAQRGIGVDALMSRLRQAGVTRQAVIDLVANQAAFREAMRQRFLARAMPTDSEVEAEMRRGPGAASTEVRLAELVIPVRERGELATAKLAEDLARQFASGGDFAAAARRYSRAPSAPRGGDVGWLPLDRLPPSIGAQIALLKPGQVAGPIDVPNAVVFLKLLDSREGGTPGTDPRRALVTLGRLIVPLRPNAGETDIAAATVEAEQLGLQLASCADVEARKAGYARGSGVEGPVPLDQLPDAEREAVAALQPGQVSPPVRLRNGIAVIVMCARSGGTDPTSIEQVRNRLINERMVSFAQGYLQELRRDAVIEYR